MKALEKGLFLVWELERYFGFKENGYYLNVNNYCTLSNRNYKEFFENWDYYINKARLNGEKFCDLGENIDLYCKYLSGVFWIAVNEEKTEMARFCDKYEVDRSLLGRYTLEEDGTMLFYVEKIEPYKEKGEKIINEMRKRWEKEWEEGRRNYSLKG